MSTVSVLIVVYNPGDEIKDCLNSLSSISDDINLEIILVDNASTNDYLDTIKTDYPQVQFIHSETNSGFGGGNNLAFEHGKGDYIICVNPDVIINEIALSLMLTILEEDETIGIVGPKTMDVNGELTYTARADYTVGRLSIKYLGLDRLRPQFVYGDYPNKMENETKPFECDWLQGSCLLMRRETYTTMEGFDDTFFLYLEDTDICQRVRQSGLKVIYVPEAIVSHIGGSTTSKYPSIRVRSYHHSPIHYHRKQGHYSGVCLLKLLFMIELITKIIGRSILNLIRMDKARKKHIQAEIQVLSELGSY